MAKYFYCLITTLLILSVTSFAQQTKKDTLPVSLDEVVISANKFPEKKRNIAQRIDKINS